MRPQNKALWPQVAKIKSYFRGLNGNYAAGTGTLVNPRMVLTAGHVVYDPTNGRGGVPDRVVVELGNGRVVSGSYTETTPEWKNIDSATLNPVSAYDLGAVILDQADAVNDVVPAVVYPTLLGNLLHQTVNVVGYPAQPDLYSEFVGDSGAAFAMAPPLQDYRIGYPFVTVGGIS